MVALLVLIYINFLIFSILATKLRYNRIFLANTLFTVIWTLSGILSLVVDIGTVLPSVTVHFYALFSILVFNIVYLIFTQVKDVTPLTTLSSKPYKINYKSVYIIEIIAIILIIPNLVMSLQILLSVGFDLKYVRDSAYLLTRFDSQVLNFFFRGVPLALFSTIMLLSIYSLVTKGERKLLYLTFFNLIIEVLTFGGRGSLWDFVAFMLGAMIITNVPKKIRIKSRKYIYFIITSLIIITVFRGVELGEVADTVYLYLVAPFSYLEVILDHPLEFGLKEPLLLGYFTFSFILEPIVLILKSMVGLDIKVPSYYFNIYAQNFTNIGRDSVIYYNNNTTMIYPFLRDFGIIGIILGASTLAFITCYFQKKGVRQGNIKYQLLLIFMYNILFDSAKGYGLINTTMFIIFWALTFIKIKKIK